MKSILLALAVMTTSHSALAFKPGIYQQALGDSSTDILIVKNDQSLSIEQTRQVGGPGGMTNGGLVPYETDCRYIQWATIVGEDADWIQYQVKALHMTNLKGLAHTEHCAEYEARANTIIMSQAVIFSLKKSEYKKVK